MLFYAKKKTVILQVNFCESDIKFCHLIPKMTLNVSDAASGWAGWALAHPEFGTSVNPITTRWADYAHHITASPPGFEIPAASLNVQFVNSGQPKCQIF